MRALAAVTLLVAVASSVGATHFCEYPPHIDTGIVYVAIDEVIGCECMWWPWTYVEANGIEGLQRGGEALLHGDPDICQTTTNPDLLVT